MDEDIITLSSDEDSESSESSNSDTETVVLTNSTVEENKKEKEIKVKENQKGFVSCQTTEVVDLVDCADKPANVGSNGTKKENDNVQNHTKINSTVTEENFTNINTPLKNLKNGKVLHLETSNDKNSTVKEPLIETDTEKSANKIPQASLKAENGTNIVKNGACVNNINEISQDTKDQTCKKSKKFMEFLEYCGSFEENPDDRKKFIEKLNKYFSAADHDYVHSKEFWILVGKCRKKIQKNNLYIMAKMIADELSLRKNVKVSTKEEFHAEEGEIKKDICNSLRQQKRLAKIQKIIERLNQMGNYIKELEKEEVDLSDEEDSVYLKLQRYRERFWIVYKKLCEYTNDVDMDRIFNQKIQFTETNFPEINKCIEKWLNKTKSFPDFTDIMKILQSQSSQLKLPSRKELLRPMAVEIFQKVGNVLQIRRKYDLWNSFCGFLEDSEDPALKHPELENIFKENYEARIKKEKEIYQHYAELQEKQSLQPKEVSEEEANHSPDSGKEEEEEIINIEESLGDRLINKPEMNHTDQDEKTSSDGTTKNTDVSATEKESKNNFKRSKSSKRVTEIEETSKNDKSENEIPETDVDNKEKTNEVVQEEKKSEPELILVEPELILVEPDSREKIRTPVTHRPNSTASEAAPTKKRAFLFENEKQNSSKKKKCLTKNDISKVVELNEDGETSGKIPVFDIGFCQIVTNSNFKEKRKVFRDLTNVKQLMKKPGSHNKMTRLFTLRTLYSRNSLKKVTPWKKKFKVQQREMKPKNQKCALNEEEKTNEKISSNSSRDTEEKDSKENADNEKEGADFRGQGNGQEEDNNDKGDENRKNGKVEDENEDHEKDDDEEKEDENAEAVEHSSNAEKTERENEDLSEATGNENHTLDDTKRESTENVETSAVECTTGEDRKQRVTEEAEGSKKVDGNVGKRTDAVFRRDTRSKSKDFEYADEFEHLNNSLEPICVLKEGGSSDIIEKANSKSRVLGVGQKTRKDNKWNFTEKLKEKDRFKIRPFTRNKLRAGVGESSKSESHYQKRLPVTAAWTPPAETSQPKPRKMSASDEERVKRFLMHSPSSISITPPKKLTLSKPPSESALQALATLRNLKGISATIVKGKPKTEEDVTVIGSQSRRQANQSSPVMPKRRRTALPVISNVQSVNTLTPKIVTVQGNVSGFENNLWPETRNNGSSNPNSSSIRISKVWGSLPETIVQGSPSNYPGCSSRKSNPGTSNQVRKKNPKKQVEYVVLD